MICRTWQQTAERHYVQTEIGQNKNSGDEVKNLEKSVWKVQYSVKREKEIVKDVDWRTE